MPARLFDRRWQTLSAAAEGLTDREIECLTCCMRGKTYWETGVILGIARRTVVFHMQSAREKLDASTNAEAVAKVLRGSQLG